jgi:hypothetical protein
VHPGPLRVLLHRHCEGTLVDISESGALMKLPTALPPDKSVTLHIDWGEAMVPVRARVVRSVPQPLHLEGATLARSEHHIAVEFGDLSEEASATLRRIIESA